MRLFAFVISSICGSGYLLTSITLSRKWIDLRIVFLSLSQFSLPSFSMFVRFMEPRLQLSFGCSGCSPQGFVLSINPKFVVGFFLFISSMNIIPGSPERHAFAQIRSNISLAFSVWIVFLVRGFTNGHGLFLATASMNASVVLTDMLKLRSESSLFFDVMNSRRSGWSHERTPIFAPLLFPPCFMTSVVMSNIFMKLTGPDAGPFVLMTISFRGLSFEKLNPVPPPDWWIIAMCFSVSNISVNESPTGRTKQADSCPIPVPAFISVGVFGRKSSELNNSKNSSSVFLSVPFS